MSETINLDEDPGLQFERWESQNNEGEVKKKLQKEKAVETTRYYANLYTNARRAKENERRNAKNSFDTYIGINERQWAEKDAKKLKDQNRPVNTFNVTKPNVDKVYGQLVLNPNKIYFSPINANDNAVTNIVQSLYEYDYERGGWQKEKNKFTKEVLIHTGVLEMYKDYRHSKLGNIGIRSLNRYLDIDFDPYWTTDDMNDCNYIFKSSWMTAREIKDQYRTKSDEIDMSINNYEARDGSAFDIENIEELQSRDTLFYDATKDRYRVIEVTYMQQVYRTKKYSNKLGRFLDENENPDTMRGENDTLVEYEEYEKICKVMTIAPGVMHGLILQEGDHPIQVGRLPYFVASSDVTMGERQGVVTGVRDAQMVLNKRQSMITGNQITSSNGGLIVKESFFKDKAEHEKFVRKRNVPGMVFTADDNVKLSDGIIPIPQGQQPEGMFEQVQWTQNFIETYMNNTDAISGRSGGANESGVLFESKKSQSQVAHISIVETIAQIDKEIAEAYFYACKKVYANVNRKFTNAKTGVQFEINKRQPIHDRIEQADSQPNATVNGFLSNYRTINEIATLPRHDVVIKRSEMGLDQKQRSLAIYSEMQQRSANPIMKSLYEKAMIPLLEIPESMIEDMKDAADIFVELQLSQTKNNIKLLNDGMTQSDINTKMLEAQAGAATQQQQQPAQDARAVANTAGNGNLPQGIASDMTGANNQSPSDV